MKSLPTAVHIEKRIYLIRGHKVMLDSDLAQLYGVEVGALIRALKRNQERFPEDFHFQLTKSETLRCQIGISNKGRGGSRIRRTYDQNFSVVFDAIGRLLDGPQKKIKVQGFQN